MPFTALFLAMGTHDGKVQEQAPEQNFAVVNFCFVLQLLKMWNTISPPYLQALWQQSNGTRIILRLQKITW